MLSACWCFAGLQLSLSPDSKSLAIRDSSRRRVALLSVDDGFQEVASTFEVPPYKRQDGQTAADTIISCCWSGDSKLLLLACRSSALYVLDRCADSDACRDMRHRPLALMPQACKVWLGSFEQLQRTTCTCRSLNLLQAHILRPSWLSC